MTRYHVVAGNRREFDNFVMNMSCVWGFTHDQFIFVDNIYRIRGLDFIRPIYVGSYSERSDYVDIFNEICFRNEIFKIKISKLSDELLKRLNQ